MIFERLTLHNFQRYGGSNTIEFPDPEETSLVVILAPNNTGKTTILRAIDFLFYGSLGGEGSETAWKLVTDVVRDETKAGTEVKAWVEARLKFPDNQTLTVRRQITARRPTENMWMAEFPKLLWRRTDSPNEKFQADDGHYQVKIDNAVPQDLFSWFYFQGEPANGKMGRGATASVLEPLKKVLQIRRWKDARNNVQAVIQSLTQQEAKEAGANKAFIAVRERESVVRKGLESNRLGLNTLKTAEAELGRSKTRLDTELAEVSSQAKASQELYALLQKHKLDEQQAQQAIKTADGQVCELVKSTLAIPLLEPAFSPADWHLEDLRTRNLLPADVSKGFIERLLKGEQCVCGTCLDATKREELTKYLGLTLAAQTNRDLVALADALEGGKESALRKKAAAFPARLTRLTAERSAAVDLLKRAQDAIEGLMPKIEKASMDRFAELVNLVRKAEREISDNQRSQADKAESIRRQESTLAGIATELTKARPKRGAEKMEGIAKAIEMAETLRERLIEGETKFRQAVHGILQERLTHYFGVATSGNTAWIDKENFLPSMHDRNNLIVTNPGGGEQQVLNLAFVIALAEMRTMINEDMTSAGLGVRLLGDQSFVLDSPFTSADPNFMKAIAEFLPGKAPQMLLLLAKQNWPDSVRETLEPHISRVYGVRLHTPVTPNDPESFRFQWKGKTVDLREPIAAGQPAFSTFQSDAFQARIRPRVDGFHHLLIADECHNLGAENIQKALPEGIQLRLGLSATPERHHDPLGTQAIVDYFGGVVYEFTLARAIAEGQLCQYRYHPVLVSLSDTEAEEYAEITAKLGRMIGGKDKGKNEEIGQAAMRLLIRRARLLGSAVNKQDALDQVISSLPERPKKAWFSNKRERISSAKFRPLRSSQAAQFRKPRSIAGHCGL